MSDTNERKAIRVPRPSKSIYGKGSFLTQLRKAVSSLGEDEPTRSDAKTNAGIGVGVKGHLIDKRMARELRDFNATHAICIDAKKSSSVGLGHRDRKIHDVLDPLCRFSWQDVLDAAAEDYAEGGDALIEVVYGDESDPTLITGLHHLDATLVQLEVEEENNSELYHYIVDGEPGSGETLIMAKWGDLADLKRRYGVTSAETALGQDGDETLPVVATRRANDAPVRSHVSGAPGRIVNSEVIHIRQATNRSRFWGYPDYMSAVPSIELVQCMTQYEFDFYFNRGVPEFMLFLIGKNIGSCWEEIEEAIKASQGLGNSHKTVAVHIPGNTDEVAVQVEFLATEDAANTGFSEKSDTLDMRIATAHGMPPALANIALPGKIGASNEGPNAMLTFQMRKLGQIQKNFSARFAATLASEDIKLAQPTGSPAKLTRAQFLGEGAEPMDENGVPQFVQPGNGFATILDGMTLGAQNTMATMKEPLAGSGRNPEDGKLDGARDRKPGDPKQTRPAAGQKPAQK